MALVKIYHGGARSGAIVLNVQVPCDANGLYVMTTVQYESSFGGDHDAMSVRDSLDEYDVCSLRGVTVLYPCDDYGKYRPLTWDSDVVQIALESITGEVFADNSCGWD